MSRNFLFHTGSGVPLFLSSNLNVGFNTKNPQERLQFASGHAKFSSNVYVLQQLCVGGSNANVTFEVRSNDAILLPKGTSLQRPAVQESGQMRYNTDTNQFEGYGAGAWGSLGGVKDTNQDTYISAESYPTSNDDILRFFNSNIETVRITKAGNVGIGTSNPLVKLAVSGTDAMLLPVGTTAQRPAAAASGYIRYNTTLNQFEGYASAWGSLGGVKDTNQDTYISAESYPTSNDDVLRFFNSNVETMRITKTGLVGISTSNPLYTLDLGGNTAQIANYLLMGNQILSRSNVTMYYGCNQGFYLRTYTSNDFRAQNYTDVLYASPSGNVGIGTLAPDYKLHVAGAVTAAGYCNLLVDSYSNTSTTNAPTASALKSVYDMIVNTSNSVSTSSTTSTASITWTSNTAVSACNTAIWTSNNAVYTSGGTITGTLSACNITACNATITGTISGSNMQVNRLGIQSILVKKTSGSNAFSIYSFNAEGLINDPAMLSMYTTANVIRFLTSNTEVARFESSNLGIRTNGLTPQAPLHVVGNAYLGQGFSYAAASGNMYGGPFFKQMSWDAPSASHTIAYGSYCIGDNASGTLHIQVSNKQNVAQSKLANLQVSFLKRWGAALEIFVTSMHQSATLATLSVSTNGSDAIVVRTDSDCSISWTAIGSY